MARFHSSTIAIEPFTFLGYRFVQAEQLGGNLRDGARRLLRDRQLEIHEDFRPTAHLCRTDEFDAGLSSAWKEHVARGGTLDFETFTERYEHPNDFDCDPRSSDLLFGLLKTGGRIPTLVGAWSWYNVDVIEDSETSFQLAGSPAPGHPLRSRSPAAWHAQLGNIVNRFLRGGLEMRDGRSFAIAEARFPTDDDGAVWDGPDLDPMLAEASTDGRLIERKRGRLRRLR